jgi:hypothetical protein
MVYIRPSGILLHATLTTVEILCVLNAPVRQVISYNSTRIFSQSSMRPAFPDVRKSANFDVA